jgi:hypothetical protein
MARTYRDICNRGNAGNRRRSDESVIDWWGDLMKEASSFAPVQGGRTRPRRGHDLNVSVTLFSLSRFSTAFFPADLVGR